MKYGIIGDIHANLEAFNAVLEVAKNEGVEKYLCIGDVVGYNANPHECMELLKSLEPLAVVKGNHDDYASNGKETLGFNPLAARAVEWTRSQLSDDEKAWLAALPPMSIVQCDNGFGRIQIVHATLDNPNGWGYIFDKYSADTSMRYQRFNVCFVGHTHVPVMFDKFENEITQHNGYEKIKLEYNHRYLINVGSVGQPRDGDNRAAFAILDTDEQEVTLHRVEYDYEETQRKVLEADLPERLALRLEMGR